MYISIYIPVIFICYICTNFRKLLIEMFFNFQTHFFFRIEGDNDFMNDFSDLLLQKLFTTSIKACQDSDKVKSNAVRALGNILRYLPIRSLGKYFNKNKHQLEALLNIFAEILTFTVPPHLQAIQKVRMNTDISAHNTHCIHFSDISCKMHSVLINLQ